MTGTVSTLRYLRLGSGLLDVENFRPLSSRGESMQSTDHASAGLWIPVTSYAVETFEGIPVPLNGMSGLV